MEMGDLILDLHERMQCEGFTPDAHTYAPGLKACAGLAAQEEKGVDDQLFKTSYLEQGRTIHAEVTKRGFESEIFIVSTLVDMYSKCGSIHDARQVFEKMIYRNLVSWTSIITGYAKMEMGDVTLELYARMQHEGFRPDAHTFAAVLKVCASLAAQEQGKGADGELHKARSLEQGRAIHAAIVKRGFELDMYIADALVDMYVKCGSIVDACQVFQKMRQRDVVSWTNMILGYVHLEMGAFALELYGHMQNEGFVPDVHTFVAALKACASLASQEQSKGTAGGLLQTGYLKQGKAIHVEVARRGFESYTLVANTLVNMYAKCGSMEEAFQVFQNMKHRNVVSWNTMIIGYAQMEMGDTALELYSHMQCEGFIPDVHTFVAALQACVSLASLESGKEIHSQIQKVGLQSQLVIANCIIDMYGKCGSMWDAQNFFDSLFVRNPVTWNALIAGYSGEADSECVFDVHQRMQQAGVKPDGITFVSILNVCSHNGLVEKGQIYFQSMFLEYGLFPSQNHYTCMTDLLGRAGQLDAAASMVMKMPFEPDIVTWMSILGACTKCNNMETGRDAFECLVIWDKTWLQHMYS